MITGSGAVGSFLKKFIKSGSEKKPARTKNKNDNLFKTPRSLNESDPYIVKIIPKIVSPNTKQNVSNILTASEDGDSPKASTTRAFNISWLNRLNISGIAWINIRAIFILNIVLIFIVWSFDLNCMGFNVMSKFIISKWKATDLKFYFFTVYF